MMMNTTSAATTLTPAYYRAFESQSQTLMAYTAPPAGKVAAEDQALDEARQQTYDLQFLSVGWNGYDALPPSKDAVDSALRWLVSSYAECKDADVHWYKPNVGASAEGEVVFWWVAGNHSLGVYIDKDEATFHQSLDGGGSTQHTHGDAPMGKHQAELMRWFSE